MHSNYAVYYRFNIPTPQTHHHTATNPQTKKDPFTSNDNRHIVVIHFNPDGRIIILLWSDNTTNILELQKNLFLEKHDICLILSGAPLLSEGCQATVKIFYTRCCPWTLIDSLIDDKTRELGCCLLTLPQHALSFRSLTSVS